MLLAAVTTAISTGFAAVAAIAALLSGRHESFIGKTARSVKASAPKDLRRRQLEQLGRVSELVAAVRQTAREEANLNDNGRLSSQHTVAPFFWNARKQLELSINVLLSIGGPPLPRCNELATGSTLTHLNDVVSHATDAFDELASVATELAQAAPTS